MTAPKVRSAKGARKGPRACARGVILHQRLLCKMGAGLLGFLQKNLEPGGIATETVDRFPVCKSRLQAAADKAENSHNWCDILPREAPSSLSSGRLRGGTHRETGRLSEQRCVLPHPSLNHPALPDPVLEPHAASWCPCSHHSSITTFSLHSPPGASHPHLWPDGEMKNPSWYCPQEWSR